MTKNVPNQQRNTKETIAVTGAGGFIGGHICEHFSKEGHPVLAISRPGGSSPPAGCETIAIDITQPDKVVDALKNASVVIHAAFGDHHTTVDGTAAVLDAATQNNCRVIHISSVAVYGDTGGVFPENTPFPDTLSGYALDKAEAERLCRKFHANGGQVIALRPGIVTGSGSRFWVDDIARRLETKQFGSIGRFGAGVFAPVHWQDLMRAIEFALPLPPSKDIQIYNVSGSDEVTWNQYFLDLAQALNYPVRTMSSNGFRARKAIGLVLKALARIVPWLPGKAFRKSLPTLAELKEYRTTARYPTDRLRQDTGWAPQMSYQTMLQEIAEANKTD